MLKWIRSHRSALSFGAVVLVAFLAVLGLSIGVHANRVASEKGTEAHDALCVFKLDLKRRIVRREAFIAENPGGVAGVTEESLKSGLAGMQQTYDALAKLKCPDMLSGSSPP